MPLRATGMVGQVRDRPGFGLQARVRGPDALDIRPDDEFRGFERGREQRGAEVGPAPAQQPGEPIGPASHEARDDGDHARIEPRVKG